MLENLKVLGNLKTLGNLSFEHIWKRLKMFKTSETVGKHLKRLGSKAESVGKI